MLDNLNNTTTAARGLRLGVAGPVGTGKSTLIATICRELASEYEIAVVTNDIYTDEDARLLRAANVLPIERIVAVETGACPHTAIRDDVTPNLIAVEDLERQFHPLDMVIVESGGDNLTATFSPALVDARSSASTSRAAETSHARAVPESSGQICWWSTRSTWPRTSTSTRSRWLPMPRPRVTDFPFSRSARRITQRSTSSVRGSARSSHPIARVVTPRRIRGRWRRTSMPMKKTTVTVTGTATLTLTDAHWSYAGRRRESG